MIGWLAESVFKFCTTITTRRVSDRPRFPRLRVGLGLFQPECLIGCNSHRHFRATLWNANLESGFQGRQRAFNLERDTVSLSPRNLKFWSSKIKAAGNDLISRYRNSLWVTKNVSPQTRRDLEVIAVRLSNCLDLLDLSSSTLLSVDVWRDFRNELSAALSGGHVDDPEMLALTDVVKRHQIPHQFLFDMLRAADFWIRFGRFETWDQLETFASDLGGSAVVASCCVMGIKNDRHDGFYEAALNYGAAIMLTQKLAHCVRDLKANRNFLAAEDLQRFKVDTCRVQMLQPSAELTRFVRFTVTRIEKLFVSGERVLSHLEIDGRRSLTSLMSLHWRMLVQMRRDPDCLFDETGVLSQREIRGLKLRHFLGTEGGLPFF